jgi:hypothetical protein
MKRLMKTSFDAVAWMRERRARIDVGGETREDAHSLGDRSAVASVENAGGGAIVCSSDGGAGARRGVRDEGTRLIRAEFRGHSDAAQATALPGSEVGWPDGPRMESGGAGSRRNRTERGTDPNCFHLTDIPYEL